MVLYQEVEVVCIRLVSKVRLLTFDDHESISHPKELLREAGEHVPSQSAHISPQNTFPLFFRPGRGVFLEKLGARD